LNPRTDDTSWGTAALRHAVSWPHIDDEGFGTVVTNMAGTKYWVVARPRRDAPSGTFLGNMGTVKAFGETLKPTSANTDIFEHEGVLLTAGTIL
jgi:hypothetical protein